MGHNLPFDKILEDDELYEQYEHSLKVKILEKLQGIYDFEGPRLSVQSYPDPWSTYTSLEKLSRNISTVKLDCETRHQTAKLRATAKYWAAHAFQGMWLTLEEEVEESLKLGRPVALDEHDKEIAVSVDDVNEDGSSHQESEAVDQDSDQDDQGDEEHSSEENRDEEITEDGEDDEDEDNAEVTADEADGDAAPNDGGSDDIPSDAIPITIETTTTIKTIIKRGRKILKNNTSTNKTTQIIP